MTKQKCLNDAMKLLAAQPRSLFIGQGVASDGIATFADFEGVPMSQRIEYPVAEELQLGHGIGLALMGYLPVLVYPRCDFLLRAADQLVNHLDKIEAMSFGQWVPKVIIRTRVGSTHPLNPGPQHSQNHAAAFRRMLTNINVWEIVREHEILTTYTRAIQSKRSSLIVENIQ